MCGVDILALRNSQRNRTKKANKNGKGVRV